MRSPVTDRDSDCLPGGGERRIGAGGFKHA